MRGFTTAPPKPSAQTQILLEAMASSEQREEERWDRITESIDLLFAKVGEIDRTQQKMNAQMDLSAQLMERMLQDQQTLAKQIEITGQAVARIVIDQQSNPPQSPCPLHEEDHHREFRRMDSSRHREVHSSRPHREPYHATAENHSFPRNALPKLAFPLFTGANPTIWKDKCLDYFHIFNIPESLWVTSASMHMDENSSKWFKMHKLTHGLEMWSEFIAAVESQFGSYDYRDSMGELVSLYQEGTLEDYISAFEDLQYRVAMHNTGLDQVYFVTQFIKGLKPELRASVQSQVPKNMKKAIMLAKVQQQVLSSKHFKSNRFQNLPRPSNQFTKFDTKSTSSTSSLWKERQLRDFRKASGLCMYCGDKFDAAHAVSCSKRPQPQVHSWW